MLTTKASFTLFRPLLPQKLRSKMLLLAVIMVCFPTLIIAYFVEMQGKEMLLQEKQETLFGITKLLDRELGEDFNPAGLSSHLNRQQQINQLNRRLFDKTERLTQLFPHVGVGYYHKQLDAIITYSPHEENGNKVGISISPNHPGRKVMASGKPLVETGQQVRGNIMNAMFPIIRHGEVLGYIWANELITEIKKQTAAMELRIMGVISVGLLLSLLFIAILSRRFSADIDTIKEGLQQLPCNLQATLPPLKGEMGEIANSVNQLAKALRESKTVNEEIQRRIVQAERLAGIGELMAGIAHEVRNPLTAIRGFVQYLHQETSQQEREEYLDIIIKEVDSINKVIQQLLDFARSPTSHSQPVVINQLIAETLVLVKTYQMAHQIQFVLNLDENLAALHADREMLKQVLLNLLINAMQSIEQSGMITITTRRSGARYQEIEIQDTGCGISEEIKHKVFTPFFTTKPSGTGLGLAFSQKIIAAHGGDIFLLDNPPGGTIAILKLPVTAEKGEQ